MCFKEVAVRRKDYQECLFFCSCHMLYLVKLCLTLQAGAWLRKWVAEWGAACLKWVFIGSSLILGN